MPNEKTYACLPCRDLDESLVFYQAMGFTTTYRQERPNPYGVVARDDWQMHIFGMPAFDPANSYGTVIVVVPDTDALYTAITQGLKAAYGKVPSAGIPRVLRPRKKYGTISGFSVVDPGGNWLRIYSAQETETVESTAPAKGLAHIHTVAARLGDARGDEAGALKTLEQGLRRYQNASALDRVRAQLYQAELLHRLSRQEEAIAVLQQATAIPLDPVERASVQNEIDETTHMILP